MDKEFLTSAVEKFQAGDKASFDDIYSITNQNLYIYAKFLMKDDSLASDLLQNTYVEILKSIKNLKDSSAFLTWSKRIMFNQSTRLFNNRDVLLNENGEEGASFFDEIKDEDIDYIPEERINIAEVRKIVMDTVQSLSPPIRMTVLAFYFDELTITEIARMFDVSENTVKSRLFKGRQTVKARLEKYEKENDIQLHSLIPIPLITLTMQDIAKDSTLVLSKKTAAEILQSIYSTVSTSAKVVAISETASSTVKGGIMAGKSIATTAAVGGQISAAKVIAGIAVGALLLGGGFKAGEVIGERINNQAYNAPQISDEYVQSDILGVKEEENPSSNKERELVLAKNDYLSFLLENEDSIRGYSWQKRIDNSSMTGILHIETPIAFYDVNKDEIPEMFVFISEGDGYASLKVFTFSDDAIKPITLVNDEEVLVDANAGAVFANGMSGANYAVIGSKKEDVFYTYFNYSGGHQSQTYSEFHINDKYEIIKANIIRVTDAYPPGITYLQNEELIESAEWSKAISSIHEDVGPLLLYSGVISGSEVELDEDTAIAMTFEEAVSFLKDETQQEVTVQKTPVLKVEKYDQSDLVSHDYSRKAYVISAEWEKVNNATEYEVELRFHMLTNGLASSDSAFGEMGTRFVNSNRIWLSIIPYATELEILGVNMRLRPVFDAGDRKYYGDWSQEYYLDYENLVFEPYE